jgi:putative ABC transport system substrate-binding protein
MKKALSIILVLALTLGMCMSLASCKKENKDHYVVGIIQLAPHPALDAATQGFKDALTAKLQAEGKTVEFKYENAQGDSNTCNTIVNSFVSSDVDLIMANATAALAAAYNATDKIPILGTSITEYGVALDLDNFNGTVGGNVSGTSDLAPLTEQAQMMIDTLGLESGAKIGLIYCSSEPNSQYQVDVVKEYLNGKGMVCTDYKFSDSNDLSSIAAKAADESDAIYVPTDNTVASNTEIINNVCAPAKVPIFAGEEATCTGCGYATLSISYYNIGSVTGEMAAEILLGTAKIEDMAIRYDANPVKKYNKAACENLGIDIAALEAAGYTMIEGTDK